jgi:Na+-transporting NADH:ubiquinone oxidoreductase subunit C
VSDNETPPKDALPKDSLPKNSLPKNKDSMKNVIVVSLLICFVCSVVVSSAAVFLKPQRIINKELDRNKNILQAAGLYDKSAGEKIDIAGMFEQFEIKLVDLDEKRLLSDIEAADLGLDTATYDQRKAAKNPDVSKGLETAEDIASISRRARYSVVYMLKTDGDIDKIVIPIHGYGLWSILYGFIALEGDMNTVSGITFHEHGETAGLGGEVDNPKWKGLWPGKSLYRNGEVALKVIKGNAISGSPDFVHQIDGLSGATLTSRGVENLVAYWMGDDGFGPVLDVLRPSTGS